MPEAGQSGNDGKLYELRPIHPFYTVCTFGQMEYVPGKTSHCRSYGTQIHLPIWLSPEFQGILPEY
jgi:hypothetical protein